ncbi:hypothetical protein V1511DRAFT_199223 [Dipodascopsis uninucleata]
MMRTRDDFLKQWTYHGLHYDFQLNNEPPSWADGNPLSWGNEISKLQFVEEATAAAVSKDSRLLAIAFLSRILIYNLFNLMLLNELVGHPGVVDHLEFSVQPLHPDHYILLSHSNLPHPTSSQLDNVIIWELDSLGHPSCKEHRIAEADIERLTDKALTAVLGKIKDEYSFVVDYMDKDKLYNDIYDSILNARNKYLARNLITLRGSILSRSVSTITNDGRLVFYRGNDPTKTIAFDIVTRSEKFALIKEFEDPYIGFNTVALSQGSRLIAYARHENTLAIVDAQNGASLIDIKEDHSIGATIAFSPNEQYVAYSSGQFLIVRRVSDGSLLFKVPLIEGRSFLNDLCWNPSGTLIAGGGSAMLYIWDASSGELVQQWELKADEMMKHYLAPRGIQWLGHKIAFKSVDWAVNVYDTVENRKWRFFPDINTKDLELANSQQRLLLNQLHYLPSRNQLLSVDLDNAVRFWRVE